MFHSQNKLEFMLAALVWWGTNLCLVFVCLFSYFIAVHGDKPRSHEREMYFLLAIGIKIMTNCQLST